MRKVSHHYQTESASLSYQIVEDMAVPADGATQLARMSYLLPSMARARVRPMIAALAVEYCLYSKVC